MLFILCVHICSHVCFWYVFVCFGVHVFGVYVRVCSWRVYLRVFLVHVSSFGVYSVCVFLGRICSCVCVCVLVCMFLCVFWCGCLYVCFWCVRMCVYCAILPNRLGIFFSHPHKPGSQHTASDTLTIQSKLSTFGGGNLTLFFYHYYCSFHSTDSGVV